LILAIKSMTAPVLLITSARPDISLVDTGRKELLKPVQAAAWIPS
jgi:hypothetical protein